MRILTMVFSGLFTVSAHADIFEIVVSRFKPGLTKEKEVELAKSLNSFIKSRPGFKTREVFYDEKQKLYVDLVRWKDRASAEAAAKEAEKSPTCQPVFSQIEEQGMVFLHADKIFEFKGGK